jgi:hypothetical protein
MVKTWKGHKKDKKKERAQRRADENERPAKRKREAGPIRPIADSDGEPNGPEVSGLSETMMVVETPALDYLEENKQREPDDYFWDPTSGIQWERWYGKWYNPELDVWWHLQQKSED